MRTLLKTPVLFLALAACVSGTVIDERRTVAAIQGGFYDGFQYVVRQQVIEGPKGQYERTSVIYRGVSSPCRIDSPNDCERAAGRLIEAYDDRFFGAGRFF